MATFSQPDVQRVLKQVRDWPLLVRREFALEVLKESPPSPPTPAPKSLKDLIGIVTFDGPVPDDAECQRILEDELTRKHLR